jgi:hypothetical protein
MTVEAATTESVISTGLSSFAKFKRALKSKEVQRQYCDVLFCIQSYLSSYYRKKCRQKFLAK